MTDHEYARILEGLLVAEGWPGWPPKGIYDALLRAIVVLEDPLHQHHGGR